jgi:16S rRNA (cytosine967-C5)-methyltransferase
MPASSAASCLAEPPGVRAADAGAGVRAAAARAVYAVRTLGRSLADVRGDPQALADRDRALAQELTYGTLRLLPRLDTVANQLLRRPLKTDDRDVEALILVGLYQLTVTRVPPHAAVAASVEAVRRLRKPWAAPLVNALLRRFLRERERLLAQAEESAEGRWLFPSWLLTRLQEDWPDDWQAIVAASNAKPPMTLRVNPMRSSTSEYLARLTLSGESGHPAPFTEAGITLERPLPTAKVPGFAEGAVSVQDAGAQLAADILDAHPGERVLDACAAPGGKTAHILERAGNRLDLTAVDKDPARLKRVRENLRRLGLTARTVQGDAASPSGEWASLRYHRILLDVPCTATGVIRRHPDIKLLRRETDVPALVEIQARMLDSVWPLLAPGGCLLYGTCSLLPEENELQIQSFLARQRDAAACVLDLPWGTARRVGRQTLPQEGGMDGFYYAKLGKAA